ncbi:MAG: nucleoside triphosphate pyrophosphohydrolase [Bryobacteraceae bacterium]
MTPAQEAAAKFGTLVEIMARLRAPDGCPWDQKQTFDTIKPYLLEETYEVMDAIDQRNWPELSEELGDLLLQPVFFAQMAAEEGKFTISDALAAINNKLIRRHPHVFADGNAKTADDVKRRWDEIKSEEKAEKGHHPQGSILDGVPRALPALVEAEKISSKVAAVGFDWPDVSGAIDKVREETAELTAAHAGRGQEEIEHELGDLLFSLVNVARLLHVDPEQALRKTNARFRGRFSHIERQVAAGGGALEQTPLERLEEFWQEAKRLETAS